MGHPAGGDRGEPPSETLHKGRSQKGTVFEGSLVVPVMGNEDAIPSTLIDKFKFSKSCQRSKVNGV